jgi:hypothetical protein
VYESKGYTGVAVDGLIASIDDGLQEHFNSTMGRGDCYE